MSTAKVTPKTIVAPATIVWAHTRMATMTRLRSARMCGKPPAISASTPPPPSLRPGLRVVGRGHLDVAGHGVDAGDEERREEEGRDVEEEDRRDVRRGDEQRTERRADEEREALDGARGAVRGGELGSACW